MTDSLQMSDYGLWLPKGASTFAPDIDHIMILVHVLMIFMFVAWGIFLVYSLVKFRQGAKRTVIYKGYPKMAIPVILVGIVVVFDYYILFGHDIPFWGEYRTNFPKTESSTLIHVVAQQFAWNIHYPGPDGKFGQTDPKLVDEVSNPIGLDRSVPDAADDIVSVGNLHIPVNKPVIVYLSTKDMIHSFFLPVMRVKQDAIPGTTMRIWFVPTRMGAFQIACAQLCGEGHYRMKGNFIVESQEDYDAWIADQEAQLQPSSEGPVF
jgi:cytochrome c oxidase subunit 2